MTSLISKNRLVYIFLTPIFLSSLWGCYTAFQHPPINDPKWGEVQVSDDCSECHSQNKYAAPILPISGDQDFNWQFFAVSPWWQDEMNFNDGTSVSGLPEPTGPRHSGGGGYISNPPLTPIPPAPVQSLGKSGADDTNDSESKKDRRRSVGRRRQTTSDSSSDSEEKRGDRSRRSEE
jgi:hypothetical protein